VRITPNPYHWDQVNLKLFYGRHQLAIDIIADLNRSHSNAVVGGRKIGKTTLLRKIENDLTLATRSSLATGLLTLPVYIDTLGLPHPNYSGAVGELRDVVTFVLHNLAPDEEVRSQLSYTPDTDEDGKPLTKPTRKQRIDCIMRKKGIHDTKAVNAEINLLETLIEQLARVVSSGYEHASTRTHTLATRDQAWKCLKQLDSILAQLL
jgi:hypothetical protein